MVNSDDGVNTDKINRTGQNRQQQCAYSCRYIFDKLNMVKGFRFELMISDSVPNGHSPQRDVPGGNHNDSCIYENS